MSKIIIDLVMPPDPMELASIYVPLSRVKRLEDLIILRPFPQDVLQLKPNNAQLEELNRLDTIIKKTHELYHQ